MSDSAVVQGRMEDDTIKLLRECDAGIKMGIEAIREVIDYVKDVKLKELLKKSRDTHERLQDNAAKLLQQHNDEGKSPSPMAKGMSWLKTNMKLTMDSSDNAVADLMVDGCNMGTKSLHKYLNQYTMASDKAKKLAEDVLVEEEKLAEKMREYL